MKTKKNRYLKIQERIKIFKMPTKLWIFLAANKIKPVLLTFAVAAMQSI